MVTGDQNRMTFRNFMVDATVATLDSPMDVMGVTYIEMFADGTWIPHTIIFSDEDGPGVPDQPPQPGPPEPKGDDHLW